MKGPNTSVSAYESFISMKNLTGMDWVALILIIVGGLNWGLVGIFNFNLVSMIFGDMSSIARIVYALVGVSAIYMLMAMGKMGRK